MFKLHFTNAIIIIIIHLETLKLQDVVAPSAIISAGTLKRIRFIEKRSVFLPAMSRQTFRFSPSPFLFFFFFLHYYILNINRPRLIIIPMSNPFLITRLTSEFRINLIFPVNRNGRVTAKNELFFIIIHFDGVN